MVKLISSIDELEAFDNRLTEITKNLVIRTGSIFKVPSSAYHRWGIEITNENREWLKKKSGEFYGRDEKELIYTYPSRENLVKTPIRVYTETRMAGEIGWIVRELMHSLDDGKREFRICDVGARYGQATSAVIPALRGPDMGDVVERTQFHLIDRNPGKLCHAEATLDMFRVNRTLITKDDEEYLAEQPEKKFDIIISLAYFHNKSFPDYLEQLHRVLADDGALVIGDWHSALWDHPINAQRLLERIGAANQFFEESGKIRNILDAFNEHFGELLEHDPVPGIDMDEDNAYREHMECWLEIASNLGRMSRNSIPRVYFLEANETSKARIEKLEKAGFSVDMDQIRKAFPKSNKLEGLPRKMLRNSDFAVVMAAMKKRGG